MLFGLKTEPPLCHYSLWQELELKSKTDNERALEPYEVRAVVLCKCSCLRMCGGEVVGLVQTPVLHDSLHKTSGKTEQFGCVCLVSQQLTPESQLKKPQLKEEVKDAFGFTPGRSQSGTGPEIERNTLYYLNSIEVEAVSDNIKPILLFVFSIEINPYHTKLTEYH